LTLILQGIDRQAVGDAVYLAVQAPANPRRTRWNEIVRLCRLLGLGLLAVYVRRRASRVDVVCEPGPFAPRASARRRHRLVREFSERSGDYNTGGSTRRPLVTAYREDALQIASYLKERGPMRLATIRAETGCSRA